MGLPSPSLIPHSPAAPSSPSGSADGGGGSISIAVTFPDGQTAIISANTLIKPAFPGTSVTIGSIIYVPTSAEEMGGILAEINAGIQLGTPVVVLNSTAPLPVGGALGGGGVSFLTPIPASGPAYAPTDIIVSLTAPAANTAPAHSFRTDGVFLINGMPCRTQFINVFTVIITTPPLSATAGPTNNGIVDLMYSDTRGSVQCTGYFQYT